MKRTTLIWNFLEAVCTNDHMWSNHELFCHNLQILLSWNQFNFQNICFFYLRFLFVLWFSHYLITFICCCFSWLFLNFCFKAFRVKQQESTQIIKNYYTIEVWVDGEMTRWCDDDGAIIVTVAMVRQCAGDSAMTRWCDGMMTMERWHDLLW